MTASRELLAVEAERQRRRELDQRIGRLYPFVRAMWSAAEPGRPYLDNWHVEVVCETLEGVARGDATELVLCQPPRTMKSYLVNVFFPAWVWLRHPEYQFLCVSNSDDLSVRDSMRMRRVVTSEGYRELVARQAQRGVTPVWSMSREQASKVNFQNDAGGGRECAGVQARVTGKGCDYLLLDDLYDAKEVLFGDPARVAERMAEAVATHDGALLSRFNPGGPKRKICIMQRLHEGDIAGELIRRGAPSLVLPMEFDPSTADPRDRRTKVGEVLVPEAWLPQPLEAWKVALGAQASGQLQQRPVSPTGGMFKVGSWMWLDRTQYPTAYKREASGWDFAVGASEGSAATAGFVGGWHGGRVYLTGGYHGHVEVTGMVAMVKTCAREHPRCKRHVFERRAAAAPVLDLVRETVPGALGVEPDGDKVARAQKWSSYQEAGNIVLPCRCGREGLHTHADLATLPGEPWAVALVSECASFPRGVLKDRVDAAGYCVRDLFERSSSMSASVGGVSFEPEAVDA